MKTNKIVEGSLSKIKLWRVRFSALIYFALLMTLLAPISPVHAPMLNASMAHAEEPDYKSYARSLAMLDYNWNDKQFLCLDNIWTKESHWNPKANNPKSTAFGIAQMLNEDSDNGLVQISNGLRYIEHRYSTPCEAWKFWQRNNWY